MKSAPSAAFRHLCLALALLATTWAFPGSVRADAYALQTVKTIADKLKPNVLIVLETAESMQGLPGENAARYNEVGADCEDGSRFCRLVGQDGRWNFSGMGKNGMYFGVAPSTCSKTETYTDVGNTSTTTSGTTWTVTQTTVNTNVMGSGVETGTGSVTTVRSVTGTASTTVSGTGTGSGWNTLPATVTGTVSANASGTAYPGGTGTAAATNITGATATTIAQMTTTQTSPSTVALFGTVTAIVTATLTGTVTSTATATITVTAANQTATASNTVTATVSATGSVSGTGTVTATGSNTSSGTVTGTMVVGLTGGGTAIATGNGTGTGVFSGSDTSTSVVIGTAGAVTVGTATLVQTITAPIVTATITQIGTGTGMVTKTASQTATASVVGTITGAGLAQNTSYVTTISGGTATISAGATVTGIGLGNLTWTAEKTGVTFQFSTNLKTITATSGVQVPGGSVFSATGMGTSQATLSDTDGHTQVGTVTRYTTATGSAGQPVNNSSYTGTQTSTVNTNHTYTGTSIWTSTDTRTLYIFDTVSWISTGTKSATSTYGSSTALTTTPTGQTATAAGSYAKTGTASGIVTGTTNVTLASATIAGNATVTASGVATGNGQWTGNATVTATAPFTMPGTGTQSATGNMTGSKTGTLTGTITANGTGTQTTTKTDTTTVTTTITGTTTATYPETLPRTVSTCGLEGPIDPNRCDSPYPPPSIPSTPTTSGYCNAADGATCSSDGACSTVKGDFCRYISNLDGSGRKHYESCISSPGTPRGSCKHGTKTANTTCADSSVCTLPGDFCAEGQPARMCADSGLWCNIDDDCPVSDVCVPATSRMMTVKRALRRAITDYADKVNFGFMNTYQGKGVGADNASTEIFPYVRVSCSGLTTVTETKFLARGELEKAGCFSLTSGPSDTCTIDYGGNGAINSSDATRNQITYSLAGKNVDESRWAIPRSDGSGKYNHKNDSWWSSSCNPSTILPACKFTDQGTGLYEGSYYTFSYSQGTPFTSGDESLASPKYYTTYKGKYYTADGKCYNAIDAQRTDIVNDGVYGRSPYALVSPATSPYTVTASGTATWVSVDTSKETSVPVPWGGSTNPSACGPTTGATWNSATVPFLNSIGTATDTFTFSSTSITRGQKTLMTTARLEKASFGGVYAGGYFDATSDTGKLAPIGCALGDASSYMSTVKDNDSKNNGGTPSSPKPPCWTNNIVLVVDGQSNGPGDTDATGVIDCASTACASPTLAGCNCSAINQAKILADSGIQTYVVVNAPATWSTRYHYTYAFLWNLAVAGSKGHATPSFGTTEDEVYKAVSDKIAAAAYRFPYTTTAPIAGATKQDPNTQLLAYSPYLYDTSVWYPSWKGSLRAFDFSSSVPLQWDAAGVATGADPHPADWSNRRIYFSDKNGTVAKVQIENTGAVTNASDLHSAGLGASSAEATLIVQWLLGKPELKNPAPLMGSSTSSTPIVVGQGGDLKNSLSGSFEFAQNTWQRPQLVYVGGDDGMLHAFFAHVGKMTLSEADYFGGEEAFAFIPNDMLPVITKLYAQGGQRLAADKSEHIFGLAGSPKVKDMCIGSGCANSTGNGWRTVLVMPEGPGGNKPFALDITDVIDATHGLQANKLKLLWSAAIAGTGSGISSSDVATWNQSLGETTSVPAFYLACYRPPTDCYLPDGSADNRVLFASGYPIKTRTDPYASQGLVILNVDAATGAVKDVQDVSSKGTTSCTQTDKTMRALVGDVAIARDFSSASTSQNLMGAYIVDTYGNTYQYVPAAISTLYSLGCMQPLFFSPAVVQLDRNSKADTSVKHFIYLVQVTNSNLDPVTEPYSATPDDPQHPGYPGSQLVVTKLDGSVSPPIIVKAYNTLSSTGQIVLSTDPSADENNRICIQTDNSTHFTGINNTKTQDKKCSDAGGTPLPSSARPVGTPTVILRSDGLGFQVITSWYDPTMITNDCSGGPNFNYGKSYITVHEFGAAGGFYQIAGLTFDNTVLTGATFVGTGLFIDGINTAVAPQSINIGESFSTMQQLLNNAGLERYMRTTWTERVDL